jgi:hypothetical protein
MSVNRAVVGDSECPGEGDMTGLLSILGLILHIVGCVGCAVGVYVFWEEAIQTNRRWAFALFGPPAVIVLCVAGRLLSAVLGGLAVRLLSSWEAFQLLLDLFDLALTGVSAIALCAIPVAWLLCAVLCWRTVRPALLGVALAFGVIGVGAAGIYVANL